jgi:hypothetical protein
MLTVLGALAEFERELIHALTGEGRSRAKARGDATVRRHDERRLDRRCRELCVHALRHFMEPCLARNAYGWAEPRHLNRSPFGQTGEGSGPRRAWGDATRGRGLRLRAVQLQ